ncbi:hypothetical protein HanIR_Chr07g0330091 [Helianthus annuus]|nr:hypothetical protein HanIR_Chr07g0330091 [Helianthus annuus]
MAFSPCASLLKGRLALVSSNEHTMLKIIQINKRLITGVAGVLWVKVFKSPPISIQLS